MIAKTGEGLVIIRMIVLLIGAVDIFYSLFVALAVLLGRFHIQSYRRKLHVVFIALSYALVAMGLWSVIAGRAIRHDPVSWPLPLAALGFPMGIFAMYQLTKQLGRRIDPALALQEAADAKAKAAAVVVALERIAVALEDMEGRRTP